MKCYKGFDKDMKCRGYQYEVGKTYETDEAKLCETGFHACENPLDVFSYSPAGESRYAEVELSANGEKESDSKRCGKKIEINKELSIKDLVKVAIGYISGSSHAATSGFCARAVTSGDCANAVTSGDGSHAATSGEGANAVTSGYRSHAATIGDGANAVTSGDRSHAATSGEGANAVTSGYRANAECSGKNSIACAIGRNSLSKNSAGNFIVLAEYKKDKYGWCYPFCVKSAKVDGVKIKADTWYKLEKGKFVEVEEN